MIILAMLQDVVDCGSEQRPDHISSVLLDIILVLAAK
jgi:hypothetical protein